MEKKICIIPGDGVGPEITAQAVLALEAAAKRFHHSFQLSQAAMGGCAVDTFGDPLPDVSLAACMAADAVLLGAVGGPKWDGVPAQMRPERGLLRLRSAMGLFSNLRPAVLFPQLATASPLRPDIAAQGIDFIVVRELIGGAYFGAHKRETVSGLETASDDMRYNEAEIERIARVAFSIAQGRKKRLMSIDKANVLSTSRLWREVVTRIAADYPDVAVSHMYVDNAAMQLVRNPAQFDVIVTENLFGDILSDEASMITGSIGMIPSASLGSGTSGLYEPIHGSAPDIAGQNVVNPIGTILSAALLLRHSCGMEEESRSIEQAVNRVLNEGYRTADIMQEGCTLCSCTQMGQRIAAAIAE